MLTLNLSTENERELATQLLANVNDPRVSDDMLEAAGSEITELALRSLDDAGVEYDRVYTQSRGAFVIVQGGSEAEKDAWYAACDGAAPRAQVLLDRRVMEVEAEVGGDE